MKLYYDKRLKDPTYYAQQGVRNGKKTTTRNVRNFGKHSELLKITDDPIAYVREEIRKMNEEARTGKVTYQLTADFNEKVKSTSDKISSVNWLNIGYFFLQEVMSGLKLKEFFSEKTADRNMSYDCFTISRFLTYSRILDPDPNSPVRAVCLPTMSSLFWSISIFFAFWICSPNTMMNIFRGFFITAVPL